jgi:hypothetical protein
MGSEVFAKGMKVCEAGPLRVDDPENQGNDPK